MKTRTKLISLGATAALAAGVATYAFTASSQEGTRGFGPPFMRHGMGPGMMGMGPGMMGMRHGMMGGVQGPMGAPFDPSARLDALKTELSIKPGQEAAWSEYTKTLQDTAASMRTARESIGTTAGPNTSVQDRQAFITQMQERRQKTFESVKAAAEKLLASLDETQKTKAREILPGLGTSGPAMMQHGALHGPIGFAGPR